MTVYKRMKERKRGQIASKYLVSSFYLFIFQLFLNAKLCAFVFFAFIVTTSIAGWFSPPTTAFYNSMKSALNTFARDLFYIAKPYNVHISLIVPGLIETNMTAHPDQPFPHTPNRYESADNLAKIIKYQLSYNVFHIGWPYFQNIITFTIATFPIRIQLLISNMMGNHMTKNGKNIVLT